MKPNHSSWVVNNQRSISLDGKAESNGWSFPKGHRFGTVFEGAAYSGELPRMTGSVLTISTVLTGNIMPAKRQSYFNSSCWLYSNKTEKRLGIQCFFLPSKLSAPSEISISRVLFFFDSSLFLIGYPRCCGRREDVAGFATFSFPSYT